jgi:hypothetical protein
MVTGLGISNSTLYTIHCSLPIPIGMENLGDSEFFLKFCGKTALLFFVNCALQEILSKNNN